MSIYLVIAAEYDDDYDVPVQYLVKIFNSLDQAENYILEQKTSDKPLVVENSEDPIKNKCCNYIWSWVKFDGTPTLI